MFVSSLSTHIINVSNSLSRLAIKDHLNKEEKQSVIGRGTCGGIDAVNIFNPELISENKLNEFRKQYSLEDSDIVFGFCGRLCNDKGIPELVEGFNIFKNKHPDIKSKLLLVGGFDERDHLHTQTKDIMENDNDIVMTGYVDKSVIPYYYSLMDVFVFPSHREGFGMCVLEASAMEKPILVSHAHGCEDSIIENETGIYIDLKPDGIYSGMKQMTNHELRNDLGKAGREMVLQHYEYRKMWPMVCDLYKTILKE